MTIPLDLEIIENLEGQFDDSNKCEISGCDTEAAWLIVTLCCGDTSQYCKYHFTEFSWMCNVGDFMCISCGNIVRQPATFKDIARGIPL